MMEDVGVAAVGTWKMDPRDNCKGGDLPGVYNGGQIEKPAYIKASPITHRRSRTRYDMDWDGLKRDSYFFFHKPVR